MNTGSPPHESESRCSPYSSRQVIDPTRTRHTTFPLRMEHGLLILWEERKEQQSSSRSRAPLIQVLRNMKAGKDTDGVEERIPSFSLALLLTLQLVTTRRRCRFFERCCDRSQAFLDLPSYGDQYSSSVKASLVLYTSAHMKQSTSQTKTWTLSVTIWAWTGKLLAKGQVAG
ncbi:hypothetical protein C8R41DRAFT_47525 [Lentinula lateritia]|uniref:Uncharacterized protein n=1 Tax=Lentinula lateritia TaxID=40482 RepID=A0ABQ8V6H4_9AGAR|nr:hypothetical protein C8R41DRAFT_47525 [Lentinula lateritia]